jgi:WD40 repeat protein
MQARRGVVLIGLLALISLSACELRTHQAPLVPPNLAPVPETAPPTFVYPVIDPENSPRLRSAAPVQTAQARVFTWLLAGGGAPQLILPQEAAVAKLSPGTAASETLPVSIDAVRLVGNAQQQVLAWVSSDPSLSTFSEGIIPLSPYGGVYAWNIATQAEPLTLIEAPDHPVTGLAISPDGAQVLAAFYDGSLATYAVVGASHTAAGARLATFQLAGWLADLSCSPDGRWVAGADLVNFTAPIYEKATGRLARTLAWEASASPVLSSVRFSADWRKIAWVARQVVQVMDVESGVLGPTLLHEDAVVSLDWSPDARVLATASVASLAGQLQPVVIAWDAVSGLPLVTLPLSNPVVQVQFSPDGRQLAVLDSQGQLLIYSITP